VFCHLHITMNSASAEQFHEATSSLHDIAMTILAASCRLPAWPRRSIQV
jgi:hypothetical protein